MKESLIQQVDAIIDWAEGIDQEIKRLRQTVANLQYDLQDLYSRLKK